MPAKFTDDDGRDWIVPVTVPDILRVREALGVDLLDAHLFERLLNDYVLLVQILGELCAKQIADRDLAPEDFGRLLAGETLARATHALLEGIQNFFPPHRQKLVAAARRKLDTFEAAATAHGLAKLEGPEMDAILKAELDRLDRQLAQLASGSSSGVTPASSGST